MQNLIDKLAIKELVDTFLILADKLKISEQMKLFMPDASVTTIYLVSFLQRQRAGLR